VRAQFEAGAATALALAQQRTLLASQRRQLEAVREQAAQGATALMTLIGQATERALPVEPLSSLHVPAIQPGLPSMLLVRRPDIAAAEARLEAADADITAARAAMLPSLTLTATAGGESRHWGELLASPVYSLTAGLAAPIFNAGKLSAQHDLAIARREELLALYQKAIVVAFADTQAALDHLAGVQAQRQAQRTELEQARLALALAESRYRAGAETLIVLLDTQRSLYAAQDDAVQLHADELQAMIGVYRALGGGWSSSQ
jgi:NodT family efflux transporter outer membrane factor (OMF) lipoprotein